MVESALRLRDGLMDEPTHETSSCDGFEINQLHLGLYGSNAIQKAITTDATIIKDCTPYKMWGK